MLLYLLRHAHALDALDDNTRPLSPKGERQIEALAKFLRKSDAFQPTELWHSPLVRAGETALQLSRALALKAKLVETRELRPESDPREVTRRFARAPACFALVGHEPHLSALASLLITGEPSPPVVVMRKSAVLALEGAANHWAVRWHLSPDLLA